MPMAALISAVLPAMPLVWPLLSTGLSPLMVRPLMVTLLAPTSITTVALGLLGSRTDVEGSMTASAPRLPVIGLTPALGPINDTAWLIDTSSVYVPGRT